MNIERTQYEKKRVLLPDKYLREMESLRTTDTTASPVRFDAFRLIPVLIVEILDLSYQ